VYIQLCGTENYYRKNWSENELAFDILYQITIFIENLKTTYTIKQFVSSLAHNSF